MSNSQFPGVVAKILALLVRFTFVEEFVDDTLYFVFDELLIACIGDMVSSESIGVVFFNILLL